MTTDYRHPGPVPVLEQHQVPQQQRQEKLEERLEAVRRLLRPRGEGLLRGRPLLPQPDQPAGPPQGPAHRAGLRPVRREGDQERVQGGHRRGAGGPVQQGPLRQVPAVPALLLRVGERQVHRLPGAGAVHLLQGDPLPPLPEVDAQTAAQRVHRRQPLRAPRRRRGNVTDRSAAAALRAYRLVRDDEFARCGDARMEIK